MEFSDREKLVRRISNKRLYGSVVYQDDLINIIINDPSLDLLSEADWIYSESYSKEKSLKQRMTLEESYEILKGDGIWTNELEIEQKIIDEDIKQLLSKLTTLKFKKTEQKAIKNTIDRGRKRLEEIYKIKNQFWPHTIEYVCLKEKRHFLMSKCTKLSNIELLENSGFLDTLSHFYYEQSSIDSKQIRELSRTDPWRLFWVSSKNTGTSLFPHSSIEMSELQYLLVSWSRVYDFAYENSNRPNDETINDDDLFDAWYDGERKRIESDNRKNALNINDNGGDGFQEVFVPSDAESIKEIYDMNDLTGKMRIKSRQDAILKAGELKEGELPDIKQQVAMQRNREASKATMNRS